MNNEINTGSSYIGGWGNSSSLSSSSIGVNPSSRSEMMLNGSLGNAFLGGVTGPNMNSSPNIWSQNTPTQRDRIHAYMGGVGSLNTEDESLEGDEIFRKLKQLLDSYQQQLPTMQQPNLPNTLNMGGF